jgi:hypothetical protein
VKTKLLIPAVAALGLGLVLSAPVSAALTWYSPITSFEDDDLDWWIDNDNDGTLSLGDRLISTIEFNNSSGVLAGQGPTSILPAELTGVADITVTSKVASGDPGEFDFVFGPSANGLLTGGVGSVANIAGAMTVLWLDNIPDLNVINGACGTMAQCIAAASDGLPNPWLAVGLGTDADAYWIADDALDNPALVASLPATTKIGALNFNLDILLNNTGQLFGDQACVPLPGTPCLTGDGLVKVIGSGDLLGGQALTNGAFARSDTDAQLVPVPEPGSLALLGLSLAIVGATALRRKSK